MSNPPKAQLGSLSSPCCCCISQHSIKGGPSWKHFSGNEVISSFPVCLYCPLLPLPSSIFSGVREMNKVQDLISASSALISSPRLLESMIPVKMVNFPQVNRGEHDWKNQGRR